MKIEHITLNLDVHNIEFMVDYEILDDGERIYMYNDYLNVYTVGSTIEECITGAEICLRDQYNAYANYPDEKLDKNAQRLKYALRKVFPNGCKSWK